MSKNKSTNPISASYAKGGRGWQLIDKSTQEVLKEWARKPKTDPTGILIQTPEEYTASLEAPKAKVKGPGKSASKLTGIMAQLGLTIDGDSPFVTLTVDGGQSEGQEHTYTVAPLNGRSAYLVGKSTVYLCTVAFNGRAAIVSMATSASPGIRFEGQPLLDILASL